MPPKKTGRGSAPALAGRCSCEPSPICHAGLLPPGVELRRSRIATNPAAAAVPIDAAAANIPRILSAPESAEDAAPYAGLNDMPTGAKQGTAHQQTSTISMPSGGILYARQAAEAASSRCKFVFSREQLA